MRYHIQISRIACFIMLLALCSQVSLAQKNEEAYYTELKIYRDNYINTHEVVTGKDKKNLRFFPPDAAYNVPCTFTRINDSTEIIMRTSNGGQKSYLKYGEVKFTIRDTALRLFLYQSKSLLQQEQYKDYLFIPFTDLTTGNESYGTGRYIELLTGDISNNTVNIDFNKAFNPYCAYTTGYKCPIPPKENRLPVEIRAGEMTYSKHD